MPNIKKNIFVINNTVLHTHFLPASTQLLPHLSQQFNSSASASSTLLLSFLNLQQFLISYDIKNTNPNNFTNNTITTHILTLFANLLSVDSLHNSFAIVPYPLVLAHVINVSPHAVDGFLLTHKPLLILTLSIPNVLAISSLEQALILLFVQHASIDPVNNSCNTYDVNIMSTIHNGINSLNRQHRQE